MDPTDSVLVENLNLERAGRGAIVRTSRSADPDRQWADGLIHDARAS
jgi:hypothetical protein